MSPFCLNTPVPFTASGVLIHGEIHINGEFGFDHIDKFHSLSPKTQLNIASRTARAKSLCISLEGWLM